MNPIINRYKIPFLIALVVGLSAVVFGNVSNWLVAVWAFLGAILGIFIVDMEYILNAYIIDPSVEISGIIRDMIKKKQYKLYFKFLNENEYKFTNMAIHSTLFLVILAFFAFYIIVGNYWVFAKTFTVSILAVLVYKSIIELSKTKTLKRWFWFYNGEISYRASIVYCVSLVIYLFVLVSFF